MKDALSTRVRFGAFELDLSAGELLGGRGKRIILAAQPYQILRMLVEHEGYCYADLDCRAERYFKCLSADLTAASRERCCDQKRISVEPSPWIMQ